MKILEPGHKYELEHLESEGKETLTFIRRSSGIVDYGDREHPGTNTQEVIRALIDRSLYLDWVLPCDETKDAVWHLRQALYCYEVRAWKRKQEKVNKMAGQHTHPNTPNVHRDGYDDVPFSEHEIELRPTSSDGHIILEEENGTNQKTE